MQCTSKYTSFCVPLPTFSPLFKKAGVVQTGLSLTTAAGGHCTQGLGFRGSKVLPFCSFVVWVHVFTHIGPLQPPPTGLSLPRSAITSFAMQVYARQVRCLFCGCEGAQLEGRPMRCCVGRQQQPEMCEEDLSCRQYIPVSPHHLEEELQAFYARDSVCTCSVTLSG